MADNDTPQQDRTEEPTAKRLEDARKRGQVARSRELNMMAVMLAGAVALLALRPWFHDHLSAIMSQGLTIPRALTRDPAYLPEAFASFIRMGLTSIAPLFAVAVIAALIGPLALGAWTFSLESIQPKFEKLNPMTGLKRVFGWQGLSELIKALAKFLLVAAVAAALLWNLADEMLSLGRESLASALGIPPHSSARVFCFSPRSLLSSPPPTSPSNGGSTAVGCA